VLTKIIEKCGFLSRKWANNCPIWQKISIWENLETKSVFFSWFLSVCAMIYVLFVAARNSRRLESKICEWLLVRMIIIRMTSQHFSGIIRSIFSGEFKILCEKTHLIWLKIIFHIDFHMLHRVLTNKKFTWNYKLSFLISRHPLNKIKICWIAPLDWSCILCWTSMYTILS